VTLVDDVENTGVVVKVMEHLELLIVKLLLNKWGINISWVDHHEFSLTEVVETSGENLARGSEAKLLDLDTSMSVSNEASLLSSWILYIELFILGNATILGSIDVPLERLRDTFESFPGEFAL